MSDLNGGLFLLSTKELLTPSGESIGGEEYLVSKRVLTEAEKEQWLEEGFTRFLDGTFMTLYSHKNFTDDNPTKTINIATERVESLTLLDGITKVTWDFSKDEGFTYNF